MFDKEAKEKTAIAMIVRCVSVLLIIAVCFVNVPLSFAEFTSVGKVTFSATVTIPGGGDSDYDGIPDDYDANANDPYDAYEMGEDGFTNLEKYVLNASGINIFDSTIGLALSASPSTGQLPFDVTFTATAKGGNIVKYCLLYTSDAADE